MTNRALLLSIKPKYADAILAGSKSVELRRVKPKLSQGDLVLIYVTSPRSALEGAFEVGRVVAETPLALWKLVSADCGATKEEFFKYFSGAAVGYGIFINKAWSLDEAFSLKSLKSKKMQPPQSYWYLEGAKFRVLRNAGIKSKPKIKPSQLQSTKTAA